MNDNVSIRKHPRALKFLFFSEMWERFGYYLMIGIFTLYLKDVKEGFAMTESESADLYGTFIALVFLTPFLGGLIADRYLGYSKSIVFGGILMGLGYCLMGVHSLSVLYIAMTMVIVGNGFFKPNISTLLGNIYSTPHYIAKKDEGYNLFYLGINIGAFICNFFGAALYILLGWYYAFLAAGIGMFIGVIVYLSGLKHYKGFDEKKGVSEGDMPFNKIVTLILLPSIIGGVLGWFLPNYILGHPLVGSTSTDAFIFACIPVIYFYINLIKTAEKSEKKSIAALLSIFGVVVLFWAIFKQNGSALNTWADRYTNREIKNQTIENTFNTLHLTKEISYQKDSIPKYDSYFRLVKTGGIPEMEWNYPTYFRNIGKENLPLENTSINIWAPSLSQSINPFWVIILTPCIVAFFTFLNRRKKEPSTATKIIMGIFLSALSVFFMILAVYSSSNGAEKVSVGWLFGCYGMITIGELFLSPMGLSIVSKLSPVRITSLMMGGWFLATSIGNKLSGVLATTWDLYTNKANYFWVNFSLLMVSAFFGFAILKWLNSALKEKGIN